MRTRITHALLIAMTLFVGGCCSPPQQGSASTPRAITINEMREQSIIGELGLPLGTVVDIEATVIAGRELREKAEMSNYLLRVTKVDGHLLPEAVLMEFEPPTSPYVHVARDVFQLHEMKTGVKGGSLSAEAIRADEAGYVNQIVQLAIYETGGYSGNPVKSFSKMDVSGGGQGRAFGFSTWLVLLAQEK